MPGQVSRSSFVLYGELGVTIGPDSRVTGDVGVRSLAPAKAGWQLVLETGAVLEQQYRAIAPSVRVAPGAHCPVALTDRLEGSTTSPAEPFPVSLMPPLPLAPAPQAGTAGITIQPGQQDSLSPGAYGALSVHGSVTLAAGDYAFAEITLGEGARLSAAGSVRIRVLRSLTVLTGAQLRPQEEAAAAPLAILVSGTDRDGTPAVRIGEHVELHGLLSAPHATVDIGAHAEITGAVAGFWIKAAEQVTARRQDGLPAAQSDARGSQALSGAYGVPAGPDTQPVVGPLPSESYVCISIGLPVRDHRGLQDLIAAVSDPTGPQFRQYISQQHFCATYGATDADYAAVRAWADAAGLVTTGTFASNLLLSAAGTADQIQRALFVNLFYRQRPDGSTYPATDRDLSLDAAPAILNISGLGEWRPPTGQVNVTGTAGYMASDLRQAYLGGTVATELYGTGQTVGIVGWAEYIHDDVLDYAQLVQDTQENPPVFPPVPPLDVQVVYADGDPPFIHISNDPVFEACLDVDMVYAMAPGAAIKYFKGTGGYTTTLDNCLHFMANYTPQLTVASSSLLFGNSDSSQQALDQMAAQGVSFIQCSGDNGATDPIWDNLKMNHQTLVGGTLLHTHPLLSPGPAWTYPYPYYADEGAWPDSGGGYMNDNDSTAVAHVFLPDGSSFPVILKEANAPSWDNGSVHGPLDFAIPTTVTLPTMASGLAGVQIQLIQGDGLFETADNWDIAALQVSLFSPGTPQVCQLNLLGQNTLQDGSRGLVRLSDTAGNSGVGPRSPTYATGPGSGC
jgi:hypothetical protein